MVETLLNIFIRKLGITVPNSFHWALLPLNYNILKSDNYRRDFKECKKIKIIYKVIIIIIIITITITITIVGQHNPTSYFDQDHSRRCLMMF